MKKNKTGLWYPVQTLPRKRKECDDSIKEKNAGSWYPVQTLPRLIKGA
ncbi:MAG: hypothetical protein H0Z40_11350 [Desulfotomaculum sp.]|nr:hypothetical protein [Desulfotomaculum sp.]